MQDRYVGDIGDYVKLALLRAISPGYRLGVAWWRFPDEAHNGDGRHIDYLQQPGKWRAFDPELFDKLRRVVASGDRRVAALEDAHLLPGTVFFGDAIPMDGTPTQRRANRAAWFDRAKARLVTADLVFLDPDNGLETANFSPGAVTGGKCVSLDQLKALSVEDRTLVVYHHQTRRKGGHFEELRHWADRLRNVGVGSVDVIRASPYSPRAFFILNSRPDVRRRAQVLVSQWNGMLTWHPDTQRGTDPRAVSHGGDDHQGIVGRLKAWLRIR